MKTLSIKENEAGQRLDKFLRKYLREAPPSFIYKMLRKKNIVRNGVKASGSEILNGGDEIRLYLSDDTIASFREERPREAEENPVPSSLRGNIITADRDIMLFNKPAGLLTQPSSSKEEALSDLLPSLMLSEELITKEDLRAFRPAPAMRLDRNTSGIVICGVSLRGLQCASEWIRDRKIRKEYLVLAEGLVREEGIFEASLKKDTRRNHVTISPAGSSSEEDRILTGIRILADSPDASLLLVDLITGRTHQIRAHLAYLGHPVIGDRKYGSGRASGAKRQMLHAFRVTFPGAAEPLPRWNGRCVTAPVPDDFRHIMTKYGLADGIGYGW